MKRLLLILFSVVRINSFSQTINNPVFNAPAQIGNNNTQNNYSTKKLSKEDLKALLDFIKKDMVDSNFNTKKFAVMTYPFTNYDIVPQITEYLIANGFTNVSEYNGMHYNPTIFRGVLVYLERNNGVNFFDIDIGAY